MYAPTAKNHISRSYLAAAGQRQPPEVVVFIPRLGCHFGVETDLGCEVEVVDKVVDVLLDFLSLGKDPAPVGLEVVGELVGEGWNVDTNSWIVVVAPCSAHVTGPFE
jgi:hypothetical protein